MNVACELVHGRLDPLARGQITERAAVRAEADRLRLMNLWRSVVGYNTNRYNRRIDCVPNRLWNSLAPATFRRHSTRLRVLSVCISVPLWQIRLFGLFFTPSPDIRILSGFFFAGPHRPYILFSNCDTGDVGLTDENKNCSNVNTITWWCNVLKTSDSLKKMK